MTDRQSTLQKVLAANADYVNTTHHPHMSHIPKAHIAIITCMDVRLNGILEYLGLEYGDAHVIRTAGATTSLKQHVRGGNELIRSLMHSVNLLGVKEVYVIGHLKCGIQQDNLQPMFHAMREAGIEPQHFIRDVFDGTIEYARRWFGTFIDVRDNVTRVVEEIRVYEYLPSYLVVHGLVIDPDTKTLEVVIDGTPEYASPTR